MPTGRVRPPRLGRRSRSCWPASCCGPLDSDTVILPREVAWRLRGRRFTAEPVSDRTAAGRPDAGADSALIDRAAAGAAFGLLHDLELVVQHGRGRTAPAAAHRRAGHSRLTLALARRLGADPAHATFLLECASAAGLLAAGRGPGLLPTTEYDRWSPSTHRPRWLLVAEAWLRADRLFSRASERPVRTRSDPRPTSGGVADLRGTVLRSPPRPEPAPSRTSTSWPPPSAWHRPRLRQRAARRRRAGRAGPGGRRPGSGWSRWDAVSSFAGVLLARPDQPLPAELADAVPRAGGDDHHPGRPDRGRRRAAGVRGRPGAAAAGRPGVPRRRRGVPVQRRLAAPRVRCGLVGGRGARLAGPALRHRACRSRWRTWSTTSPGSTAASGSGRPRPTCGSRTRPRPRRCSTHPDAAVLGLRASRPDGAGGGGRGGGVSRCSERPDTPRSSRTPPAGRLRPPAGPRARAPGPVRAGDRRQRRSHG